MSIQRHAGRSSTCECYYNHLIDKPVTMISTIMDCIFSVIVIVSGVIINHRYRKKLNEEKRSRPPDRKGNVIEPIMRWYLNFAIVYWPYTLLFMWINANEVMPSEWFANCILLILVNVVRIGRAIIAYNSFFTAMIRYLYIVLHEKANQWSFETTGRVFQIASFGIPVGMEIVRLLSEEYLVTIVPTERFQTCLAVKEGFSNVTDYIDVPTPHQVHAMHQVFSRQAVDILYYVYVAITGTIGSNVMEAFFYATIFQKIKRCVDLHFVKTSHPPFLFRDLLNMPALIYFLITDQTKTAMRGVFCLTKVMKEAKSVAWCP